LEDFFNEWLHKYTNLSKSSIVKYVNAIKTISVALNRDGVINENLYDINKYEDYVLIQNTIEDNVDLNEKDKRGHKMYTSALNYYSKFLKEKSFWDQMK